MGASLSSIKALFEDCFRAQLRTEKYFRNFRRNFRNKGGFDSFITAM
jgi:hypothetical protein